MCQFSVNNTEEDVVVPKDVPALLTPPLEDNTTHPSNGSLAPQSPTQTPPSSPPNSPPSDPPPLSDRHGYRFRCSRCSLAFPTQEKLQLHWQYHAMRAATECPLCSRQCRSQEALQRHIQNIHSQLDDPKGQNTPLSSQTVQYMDHKNNSGQQDFSLSPQVGQEAGEGDDEDIDEDMFGSEEREDQKEVKMKEKETVSEVDCGEGDLPEPEQGPHEETLLEPTSNTLFKKSSNPTMDRFLDPSRPYKCTVCSESFTQKTILLVHYNSVSHLHRARRALQDSGTSAAAPDAPRGPDPRPYRCRLCGVGYSQSSTLDIHLRSVLHQTRARAAQNLASQPSVSSVPALVPTTSAQAATIREETHKSLPGAIGAKKPDGARSSNTQTLSLPEQIDSQQAKQRVVELLASRNQLLLIQQQQIAQAQVQAHLQQQTALLQSQALQHLPLGPENHLKQPFSLLPDNSLSLQQQLLLPFFLSGDGILNSELSVMSPELGNMLSLNSIPKEHVKADAKRESEGDQKQTTKQSSIQAVNQTADQCHSDAKSGSYCSGHPNKQTEVDNSCCAGEEEKETKHVHAVKNESMTEDAVPSSSNSPGSQCPPPRVPYAATNGEPLRALLQSYGYELAMQYIQSRHRHQQQMVTQILDAAKMGKLELCSEMEERETCELKNENVRGYDNNEKQIERYCDAEEKEQIKDEAPSDTEKKCCETGEKCQDCGKFFSDVLILKSHQEHIHRLMFPTAALERFSMEYRLQYDQMYPLGRLSSDENVTVCTQAVAPTPPIWTEPEPATVPVIPQVKTLESSSILPPSDLTTKTSAASKDMTAAPAAASPPSPSQPQDLQKKEDPIPATSTTALSQNATPILLPLPKIPMLPLSMPQISIPPLTLPKLPLPPIPFPMDLPLLPPVVMQSMALQTQPWLDSNLNPELAKLYQSQLNQAILGPQPHLSTALLAQQPQHSPALLNQPAQLSPAILSQPSQPSPIPASQQSQASPTTPEQQQGKRTRTRISEEQVSILRKHFDINSLPSDEEINKMSIMSSLPHKVIKHWFRNTLFKERQRDKDSPYNFNNPPTTPLEDSREDIMQNQHLTLSPCSLSPGISANNSPQPQTTDLLKGEPQRGRRSSRTRFTEQQLETLQGVFEATPYPREEEYDRLSALLSLPNRVIVVWFQNARQRARKNQDRGPDDGFEVKNNLHNTPRHKSDFSRNEEDNQENGYDDGGQHDSQNENSMDLTYEYYTHPDSPTPDSSTQCTEGENLTAKEEQTADKENQEGKMTSPQAKISPALVPTQKDVLDTDIQQKDVAQSVKTRSCPKPDPKLPSESPGEPFTPSSSQNTINSFLSVSHLDQNTPNGPCERTLENATNSSVSSNLPSAPASETIQTRLSDAVACHSKETQPHLQDHSQLQCNLCPVSLPSFQLWQEHQARHLLAAQSQVQLLHSGFTDRTMPYMMLHPNHTLMASQILSGSMSQMHPNPAHPMVSHLNNIQIKNTLSDQSSNSFNSSLASIKQSKKTMSETSFEGQRGSREFEEEHRRDKRQRTTITPEQLEVLYQRYSLDSNPTRGVLESIARDVGLTRRVVQVQYKLRVK